jgi:hypothetical protein
MMDDQHTLPLPPKRKKAVSNKPDSLNGLKLIMHMHRFLQYLLMLTNKQTNAKGFGVDGWVSLSCRKSKRKESEILLAQNAIEIYLLPTLAIGLISHILSFWCVK